MPLLNFDENDDITQSSSSKLNVNTKCIEMKRNGIANSSDIILIQDFPEAADTVPLNKIRGIDI
ncbi:hypothetical protein BpHYR1_005361 [Brachionus plicatilis]|uniref:Uncharacterized protein n=1 Tax=Brachionus plicatilis TaxID=10195 RepID=A0A3M7R460_BRAPC|nr:hypothetical protein BpHYR1_005361 [Brachionus plicatilis]